MLEILGEFRVFRPPLGLAVNRLVVGSSPTGGAESAAEMRLFSLFPEEFDEFESLGVAPLLQGEQFARTSGLRRHVDVCGSLLIRLLGHQRRLAIRNGLDFGVDA